MIVSVWVSYLLVQDPPPLLVHVSNSLNSGIVTLARGILLMGISCFSKDRSRPTCRHSQNHRHNRHGQHHQPVRVQHLTGIQSAQQSMQRPPRQSNGRFPPGRGNTGHPNMSPSTTTGMSSSDCDDDEDEDTYVEALVSNTLLIIRRLVDNDPEPPYSMLRLHDTAESGTFGLDLILVDLT